jgi:very-short-patch-repair endonuclease
VGSERSEPCYAGEMKRIPEELTRNARALRNNSTRAERLLWLRLRQYRPRFTRQLVIKPFILDLACREAKLAIELDGSQHAEAAAYDLRRTAFLEVQGWQVIRLWNNEVEENPDGAAEFVLLRCAERLNGATHPQPLPSREGRIRRPRHR